MQNEPLLYRLFGPLSGVIASILLVSVPLVAAKLSTNYINKVVERYKEHFGKPHGGG
jgi:hypothetical protein